MSDYLGNLAARSLAPAAAAAVQPRLASRFEPVPAALPPFRAEREPEAFETAVEERAAPAPPRSPRSVTTPEGTAPPEPVEETSAPLPRRRARRVPVEEEVGPAPVRRRLEPVAAAVVTPAPVAVAPLQVPVANRGAQPREASPPAETTQRRQGQQGRQGPQEQEKSAVGILLPVSGVPAVAAVPAVSGRPSPPARAPEGEAAKRSRPEDRQPPQQEAVSPILQPRVTVIERLPSPVRREAPAPTIQVTIGRIEVRATPAAKAPVRERPASRPSVDLEEYLRQRAKGDRR